MWGPKKLAIAFSTALVASGVIVLAPALTTPAAATEILLDGGFEAGTGDPPNSPNWVEADSLFGNPLCVTGGSCGTGGGTAVARTGTKYAWFGGSSTAGHTASLTQTLTIPAGTATLTYWYRNGAVAAPFDAVLLVKVDGGTVNTHTEAATAEGAYSQKTVNLDAYANGASHTLAFQYTNGGTGVNNMTVDDVSIDSVPPDSTAPETTFTTQPAGGVAKSLTVPFAFTATEPATYSCALDTTIFTPCTSPKTVTVIPGPHTFKVAATDSATNTDATPAVSSFIAYDCKTLDAKVAKAKKKVAKLKKKVKDATDPVKKDKLKKKLAKAKKKLKKAKKDAKPCH